MRMNFWKSEIHFRIDNETIGMSRLTDVVKNLIIINVIIYFGVSTLPDQMRYYAALGKLFHFKSEFGFCQYNLRGRFRIEIWSL